MRRMIAIALLASALAPPVFADDAFIRQGVAISQAPEAGFGICFGVEPVDAIACARAACAAESGLAPEHCLPQLWCYPHGWIADIFMMHEAGAHWHSYICDATSREELEALIAAKCDRDDLIECSAVALWDDEGTERPVE